MALSFILHMRKLSPIHSTDLPDEYLLNSVLGIQYLHLHSKQGSKNSRIDNRTEEKAG
jgi:hypothetical protein